MVSVQCGLFGDLGGDSDSRRGSKSCSGSVRWIWHDSSCCGRRRRRSSRRRSTSIHLAGRVREAPPGVECRNVYGAGPSGSTVRAEEDRIGRRLPGFDSEMLFRRQLGGSRCPSYIDCAIGRQFTRLAIGLARSCLHLAGLLARGHSAVAVHLAGQREA